MKEKIDGKVSMNDFPILNIDPNCNVTSSFFTIEKPKAK